MAKAMIITLSLLIFLIQQASASTNDKTSFDINEITSKIMYRPLKEGCRFIFYGKAYQVEYKEDGLLLWAFNSEVDNGKDILIPGKPEIKGDRIIYRDNKDKIIIQGFTQRSKVQEKLEISHSFQDYLQNIPNLYKNKSEPGIEIDFFATGELLIDTSIIPVPTPYYQSAPVVAFDGTNYLVVWEDWRNYTDIYCTRVNQSGEILDPAGIPISVAPGYQIFPAVAFDGTNYFVVWEDWRRGLSADIYGVRISPSGAVHDPYGIPISTTINDQWKPSVAFDGTNYLVVWEDWRNGYLDIYGTRVSQFGMVLDLNGISISTNSFAEFDASVVYGSSSYFVAWTNGYTMDSIDVYGTRVSPSGIVLDPNGIAISTASSIQNSPSVAFDGINFFTVWEDGRSGISFDIYGARINQTGTVIDINGILISNASNNQWISTLTFDGTNYLVAWEDYRNNTDTSDLYCARVNQSSTVLDPSGIAISTVAGNQSFPVMSFDGSNYFVVWEDWRAFDYSNIYCTRINQSGNVLDLNGIMLSTSANEQTVSTATFDGNNYLVVWEDHCTGDTSDIFGARITQSGGFLDPSHILISTAVNSQISPSVAFDGNNYLVVWSDKRSGIEDIYCTRVTQAGVILDPGGIAISTAPNIQSKPKVAFDGNNYLVVWEDYRNNIDTADIYGARLNQAGLVLDPIGFPISADTGEQVAPAVAFDGLNYLVVWQDDRSSSRWDNIYGVLVSQSGLVDTILIPICTAINFQYSPSITFNQTNYFVVWEDHRNTDITQIFGARINPVGIVLDPNGFKISTTLTNYVSPCVIFDGTNHLVVWEDYRRGYYSDLSCARVNLAGEVTSLYPISSKIGNQSLPALVHGPGNQILITYSGWTEVVNGKNYNTMRIWGKYFSSLEQIPGFGWSKKADVAGATKRIKDGGCLTVLNDKIYALVGNNTQDLMEYDIINNTWIKESEVPFSSITGKTKRVKKGACLCNDGYYIYIVKGNNTQEFYRYDPYVNIWQELLQPGFYKRIKGGSMVFDGESKIYLIGGSNKNEWKIFDIYTETWSKPNPETLPARKWKYGSFILYIDDVIYGLRAGSKTNEFYKLDIYTPNPTWTRLQDMPLYNSSGRKKKAKKGACAAFDGNLIYAVKGGNTYDFYSYDIEKDSWTQREDIGQPVGIPYKKVKGGGALTYSPVTGGLFAFVGNNTNEFWFYLPNPSFGSKSAEGKMAKPNQLNNFNLQVLPNPSKNIAKVYYSLPFKTTARIKIYNVTGKLMLQADCDDEIFTINTKLLSAGVYILKFEAGDYKATKKLLVAH